MERVLEIAILIAMAIAFIVFKSNPLLSGQIAIASFIAFLGLIALIEWKEIENG